MLVLLKENAKGSHIWGTGSSSGEMIHHFNSCIFKVVPGVFNLESPFDINGSHVAEISV